MGKRLVRDQALDNWVVPGAEHQVRPVRSQSEHLELLHAKLIEEGMEVVQARLRSDLIKELADVLAVAQAIAFISEVDWSDVLDKEADRWQSSGGFTQGMVWETSR